MRKRADYWRRCGGRDVSSNIFTTLARRLKLLKGWLVSGNHVLYKSTMPTGSARPVQPVRSLKN
jgi:hypothetical protein